MMEFKRMSCVTDQYVRRTRNVAEAQYVSIKSALEQTLGPQGWIVSQRSFIAGARSLNEKNLHDNLTYFKIPTTDIESIRSKLDFKILDEHANILKGMYSTRFIGCPENKGDHDQMDTVPGGPSPPLITSLQTFNLKIFGVKRRRRRRTWSSINTLYYIHFVTHIEGDDHQDKSFKKKKHPHTHTPTHGRVCAYTHTHIQWNRPYVSTRQHNRLYNLVTWTIKTF